MAGKKIAYILLASVLCMIPAADISAASVENFALDGTVPEERQLPRLVDNADLLTESEEEVLLGTLDEISERQAFDVVVVTVDGLGSRTPEEYADDFYDYNGYGAGENNDGALLLVSMETRKWHVSTTGDGITAITDAGLDYMSDRFTPYLSDGKYLTAFETYAALCDEFVAEARNGQPYDGSHMPKGEFRWGRNILIALGVGLVAALLIVEIMRRKLKSVRLQGTAGNYVKPGSMAMGECWERFLYSQMSRQAKPQNNGSSTHTSSSGTTHGGGGGSF